MRDFDIAPAGRDDLPALQSLLALLFVIESDFRPDAQLQRQGLALLLEEPDRAAILVARHRTHGVIGMASAQLVVSTAEGARSAWIEDVVVAEGFRGRGVASGLLAALLDWAWERGATRAQLLADRGNAPALEFYRALGWQPTQLNAWRIGLIK